MSAIKNKKAEPAAHENAADSAFFARKNRRSVHRRGATQRAGNVLPPDAPAEKAALILPESAAYAFSSASRTLCHALISSSVEHPAFAGLVEGRTVSSRPVSG